MNLFSSSILLPALKWLLVNRLQKALQLRYGNFREINSLDYPEASYCRQHCNLLFQEIPLTRNRDTTQISYSSAIALRLANEWQRSPKEIADEIYQELLNPMATSPQDGRQAAVDTIWNSISIQAVSSGWISLFLSSQGLAVWLQLLVDQPTQLNQSLEELDYKRRQLSSHSAKLFLAQYTHARCYSLLRLAKQDGLLPSNEAEIAETFTSEFGQLSDIPWITSDGTLRTNHPAERQLIAQLVHTLDEIFRLQLSLDARVGLQLAYYLSQAFQTFYATCRIWDETKFALPELAQARLGLVWITQSVLRSLLHEVIGAIAPTAL